MRLALLVRTGLLAAAVAAFAWRWQHASAPIALQPLSTQGSVVVAEDKLTPWELGSAANYTQTLERPLFYASRRHPAEKPATVPEAAPPQEAEDWVLLGVVNLSEGARALVQAPKSKNPKVKRVVVGDELDLVWRVAEIQKNAIILRNQADSERKTVTILRGQKPPSNIARTPVPGPKLNPNVLPTPNATPVPVVVPNAPRAPSMPMPAANVVPTPNVSMPVR